MRSLFFLLAGIPLSLSWSTTAFRTSWKSISVVTFSLSTRLSRKVPWRDEETKRKLVVMAESGDEDTAMNAYEQAMRRMTAPQQPPPQPPRGDPPTLNSGAGVVQPLTTEATAAQTNVATGPTSTMSAGDTSVRTYDQTLPNFAYNNDDQKTVDAETKTPDFLTAAFNNDPSVIGGQQKSDFLESFFNDPTFTAEEKKNLEAATTWTSSSAIFPPPQQPQSPQSPVFPSSAVENPFAQQPPNSGGLAATNGSVQSPPPQADAPRYGSFLDALTPNSEKKKPSTTANSGAGVVQPLTTEATAAQTNVATGPTSTMSAGDTSVRTYDQTLPNFAYNNDDQKTVDAETKTPDFLTAAFNNDPSVIGGQQKSNFLESSFNDPTFMAEEKKNLETATTWTSSSAIFPPPQQPQSPQSPVFPSSAVENPFVQQPPNSGGLAATNGSVQSPPPQADAPRYGSFLDALTPNSENKKPSTTATTIPQSSPWASTESSMKQEITYPPVISTEPVVSKDWEPPLQLGTTNDAAQTSAPTMSSFSSLQTTPAVPPPPADTTDQAQTRTEPFAATTTATTSPDEYKPYAYIPSAREKNDDPVVRAAAKASATQTNQPSAVESFLSSTWEEKGQKRKKQRFPPTETFVVKPGVSKRIFESLNIDKGNPRAWSPWDAFQNAGDRWEDLKNAKPFRYDFKLFKPIQNEAGPPLQFVSDDCAMGNAKCCAKLREICESDPDVECTNLEYVGPSVDDDGEPVMDFDVIVLGGTLGIFYGMALQLKGLTVCVAAPRELKGQEQEWNVSMEDLRELQRLGILLPEDIDAAITTVYGGTRAGFKNREVTPLSGGIYDNKGVGFECYVNNVLNLGVSPAILIDRVATRFKKIGGTVRERCPLRGVAVSAQIGCAVDLGSYDPNEDVEPITGKMVLDCMGYGSPVARQQRYGVKPDSICMVFGSCAAGYNPDRNLAADIMYTFNPLQDFNEKGQHQYFWESFPVGTNLTEPVAVSKPSYNMFANRKAKEAPTQGPQVKSNVKTTYMFTYIDAHQLRPSLEEFMEDYWKLLPKYQSSISDPETQLDINRVVYDYFPAYRDSPLKTQFSRVISVGESSGIQSPISFGGFRSLSRHIGRISGAVTEAVETGCLHKDDLGEINAYLPNLSAAWLFRDIMSVPMGKGVKPKFVNKILAIYLKAMYDLGPKTVTPFMQDVLCFDALVGTILRGTLTDPLLMGELVRHVGMPKVLDFLGHVGNMGLYSFLDKSVSPIVERTVVKKIKDPRTKFQWRRRMEAWKYGSGNDYMNKKLDRSRQVVLNSYGTFLFGKEQRLQENPRISN